VNGPAARDDWPFRKYAVTGTLALFVLVAGFGTWLATANLSGAIIVRGRVIQATESRNIQHLTGGVVDAVYVAEGQAVLANEILIRLDDTGKRSELTVLNTRWFELSARRARLLAQRDDAPKITSPRLPGAISVTDATLLRIRDGQARLFEAQQMSRFQQRRAAQENIDQIIIQITGIDAQLDALNTQNGLIETQLEDQQRLFDAGLTTTRPILALTREAAVIRGKIGTSVAQKAGAKAQISQIKTGLLQAQSKRREDAIAQLRDLEFRLNELAEQRQALSVEIDGLMIRAPGNGTVLNLGPITKNSVVQAAEVLMQIVPTGRADRVTARLAPAQIEKLYPNQAVDIGFAPVGYAQTPRLAGTISAISPGTLINAATGAPYYRVDILFSLAALNNLENPPAMYPDMPVELFIKTSAQPAWAYLAKPFLSYFSRAMRES